MSDTSIPPPENPPTPAEIPPAPAEIPPTSAYETEDGIFPVGVQAAMEASKQLEAYALACSTKLRLEGERTMLLRLLKSKFPGQITKDIEMKIRSASNVTLVRWAQRVLTESTLAQVLN